jgi:hypothetical protein
MKFKDIVTAKYQIVEAADSAKHYIDKYKMKMLGSGLDTALGWIDGTNKSDNIKSQILQAIWRDIEVSSYEEKHLNVYMKRYPWAKDFPKLRKK